MAGLTPLMVAAKEGHDETLRTLLKAGADVNTPDNAGMGAAARASSRSLLQALLSAGADLDLSDASGE